MDTDSDQNTGALLLTQRVSRSVPASVQAISSSVSISVHRWLTLLPKLGSFFLTLGCLAGLLTFSEGLAADAARLRAGPVMVFDPADDAFLEELQRASFRFFAEQAHPFTGLVSDKSSADGGPMIGKASIACSGYALAGWVIATERRWVERRVA